MSYLSNSRRIRRSRGGICPQIANESQVFLKPSTISLNSVLSRTQITLNLEPSTPQRAF
jgi:hypothetical protein